MKNIPQLRFAGFEGEWEEAKFETLANIVRGASPRPIADDRWFDDNSDVGWLRISDVTNQNGRIHKLEQKLSLDGQSKTRTYKTPHLILSIAASVGKPVINYINTGVHDGFLIFEDPIFNLEFMFQFLDKIQLSWSKYGQPGSQVNLNSEIVKNRKIYLPTLDEQNKIGELFRKIDGLIEKQEAKVSKMQDFKKSMLQKMIPKKGQLVPEFRFEGFAGKWEEISIGDKFEVTMGQSPNSENYTTDINAMILVQGNADLENGHVTPRIFTKEVTKTSKKGDILMTVRAPVGTLAVNEYDVVIGRGVCSIKGNTFLYYSLTNMNLNNYWNRFSSGSTFESINSLDIKNASLKIPSLAEQQKIGNFFKNLDRQIETEEKLLVSYKQMKKSLLQKMFV